MSVDRIDVHTHLVPPFWAKELPLHGGDPSGRGAPDWSPEQLVAFTDEERVAVSMLSLTAPGIEGWKGADRIAIARQVNDYGAGLVARHPDRLGYFAALALQRYAAATTIWASMGSACTATTRAPISATTGFFQFGKSLTGDAPSYSFTRPRRKPPC